MDFLNSIFNFVTDRSNKVSSRALTMIVTILLVLLLDNLFGFSFYYNIEKKLGLITQTHAVLSDKSISKADSAHLLSLRKDIFQRKSLKDRAWDYLIYWQNHNTKEVATKGGHESIPRSYVLHYISASCFFLLLMIILPFVTLGSREHTVFVNIFICAISEGILYVLSLGVSRLLLFIPILFGHPGFNYFLNVLINVIVIVVFYLIKKNRERV